MMLRALDRLRGLGGEAQRGAFYRLVLLIGLLHAVFYVFVVPPWQHYDEPSHFEYAALIAKTGKVTREQTQDPVLMRQIMTSMARNGFYGRFSSVNVINALKDSELSLGVPQFRHPPLYYALAALPIKLLESFPVEVQLRAARFVSVGLLGVVALCAITFIRALAPASHPLQMTYPLAVVMFPTLVELLSAVTSDALAAASASLVVALAARVVRNGSKWHAAALIAACILAWFSKDVARLVIPAGALALLMRSLHFVRLRWIGLGLAALCCGLILAVFRWGDPAGWYRNASANRAMRCVAAACGQQAGHEGTALVLPQASAGNPPATLLQVIDPALLDLVRGRTIEVSARMWSDAGPVVSAAPIVKIYEYRNPVAILSKSVTTTVTSQPMTLNYTASVPVSVSHVTLQLEGGARESIYFDEVRLAVDGNPARNFVRNGSAEYTWPWLLPAVQASVVRLLPDAPRVNFLMVPFDGPVGKSHVSYAIETSFQTFWGRFGWAGFSVPPVLYAVLAVWVAVTLAVLLVVFIRQAVWLDHRISFVLLAAFALVWGVTLIRGASYLDISTVWLPIPARYGVPAILYSLLLLSLGWTELLANLRRRQAVGAIWVAQLGWACICAATVLYEARLKLYLV